MAPEPPTAPSAARIRGNDWTLLEVPGLGGWTPTRTLSVVIPVYGGPERLARTLAAIAAQTYPPELLEVVVADDGSDPPVEAERLGRARGLRVRVVRQPHSGYGAGRARNLGARAANGEILVFLDADMVLEPAALAAHARWHHVVADAVTLGGRRHADLDGVDPARLAAGDLSTVLGDRRQWGVEWLEQRYARTGNLTSGDPDLFRVVTGGNLGVRAELFHAVGGFHPFGIRGIEDTELGYRLYTAGAVLVPDDEAAAWHQGASFFQTTGADEAKRARAARTAAYIPLLRQAEPGRSYPVPRVLVRVPWRTEPAGAVGATVQSVLAGRMHDLEVRVEPASGVEVAAVAERFEGDPRVTIAPPPADPVTAVPVQARVPPGVVAGGRAVGAAWERLRRGGAGTLVFADGTRVTWTRAWCRATRLARGGREVEDLAADLFGVERVDAGFDRFGDRRPDDRAEARVTDRVADAERRAERAQAQVAALRARRVVRVADAAGRFVRRVRGDGPDR